MARRQAYAGTLGLAFRQALPAPGIKILRNCVDRCRSRSPIDRWSLRADHRLDDWLQCFCSPLSRGQLGTLGTLDGCRFFSSSFYLLNQSPRVGLISKGVRTCEGILPYRRLVGSRAPELA